MKIKYINILLIMMSLFYINSAQAIVYATCNNGLTGNIMTLNGTTVDVGSFYSGNNSAGTTFHDMIFFRFSGAGGRINTHNNGVGSLTALLPSHNFNTTVQNNSFNIYSFGGHSGIGYQALNVFPTITSTPAPNNASYIFNNFEMVLPSGQCGDFVSSPIRHITMNTCGPFYPSGTTYSCSQASYPASKIIYVPQNLTTCSITNSLHDSVFAKLAIGSPQTQPFNINMSCSKSGGYEAQNPQVFITPLRVYKKSTTPNYCNMDQFSGASITNSPEISIHTTKGANTKYVKCLEPVAITQDNMNIISTLSGTSYDVNIPMSIDYKINISTVVGSYKNDYKIFFSYS